MGALKVWDGTQWIYALPPPSATVSATAPASPVVGQLWYDTASSVLKVWDLTGWQRAAPATPTVPAISAYKTTAQTISSGVSTIVTMTTLRGASGGMGLSQGMAQIPQDGWYQVNVGVCFQSSTSSARRIVGIAVGTSTTSWSALTESIVASAQDTAAVTAQSSSGAFFFSAGDLVGPWVNTLANWGLETSNPTYNNHLSVVYLGRDGPLGA